MTGKGIGFASGALLVLYSAAALTLHAFYPADPEREVAFCRFYVCASEILVKAAYSEIWSPEGDFSGRPAQLLEESLRRDPHSPLRWLDLAEARMAAGDEARSRLSLQYASRHGASDAAARLRAGLAYFRLGDPRAALKELTWVITATRKYDSLIFSTYDRMGVDVGTVLRDGLGKDTEATRAYFEYVFRHGEHEAVAAVWSWLAERSSETRAIATDYIRSLLKAGRYWESREVQCRTAAQQCQTPGENLILNSDFKIEPIDSPLDWRMQSTEHFRVTRDLNCGEHGFSHCAVIRFDGKENVSFQHLSQQVIARPGRHRFQVRVRAEGVTTDQGVGFRIRDVMSGRRLDSRTQTVKGTTSWLTLEETVNIGPATRLIQVEAVREKSRRFNNKIAGTVWIDSVSLRPH